MVSFWHLRICASWFFSLPLSVPHLSYCRAVTRFLREARFGEWIGALGVTSAACVSFPSLEVCSHCTDFPIWRKVKWIFKKLPVETASQDTFVVLVGEGEFQWGLLSSDCGLPVRKDLGIWSGFYLLKCSHSGIFWALDKWQWVTLKKKGAVPTAALLTSWNFRGSHSHLLYGGVRPGGLSCPQFVSI